VEGLRRDVARLAGSSVSVHIHGETGTGKEVVARALHHTSRRRGGPFVAFNAAGFGDELFDAELFGHARGAFTGAVAAREGYVARAEGGTLLIDEVGELTLRAQAKLLRFLEEREYHRLGETRPRKADVRVLSATNADLRRRVAEGRFRDDLLYRLDGYTLTLPPLRDRGEDVILLARHLLEEAARRAELPAPELTPEIVAALRSFPWPGNVRQLRSEMERLLINGSGERPARVEHLSREVRVGPVRKAPGLRASVDSFERETLRQALARHARVSAAAAELGISRQALYQKRRRYGL
jgi:DNA-binding NtrC family response regulator